MLLLAFLAFLAIMGIPGVVAYYGWIVPFKQKRAWSKPDTCYAGNPCGTCRACQIEIDREYTIATLTDIPSLVGLSTRNIRKVS